MAREGVNFAKFLRGPANILSGLTGYVAPPPAALPNRTSIFSGPTVPTPPGYETTSSGFSILQGSVGKIIAYLIGIIFVIIVISLIIHYYITPIYSLHPGAPGIILIPGFDDGVLFWNGSSPTLIENAKLPIINKYYGYSFIVDMFIQNPMQYAKCHRILLSRGLTRSTQPCAGETLTSLTTSFNFIVALKPDVNDMIIAVSTIAPIDHSYVIIENVPIQEPFRLGVIVMQNILEVYMNGLLMGTVAYKTSIKDIKGDIDIAHGTELSIAKMQNLKIWDRILSTSEIHYSRPTIASAVSFNATPIPTTTSCNQ
jgi:hypothetical protein